MNLSFPSADFDDAIAALCHGDASEGQIQAVHDLIRTNAAARDEYILRLELHSRLASDPDLFLSENAATLDLNALSDGGVQRALLPARPMSRGHRPARGNWTLALAAGLVFAAVGWWLLASSHSTGAGNGDRQSVALLDRTVDAKWRAGTDAPRTGAPLEPGWLRLGSGLAQIVFYTGARVVIEGPADLQIISASEASCPSGRLIAEIPPQARGFRIHTPRADIRDGGALFGLQAQEGRTELHLFNGSAEFQAASSTSWHRLPEGSGVIVEQSEPQMIDASRAAFASIFALQPRSTAAQALRYDQWRTAQDRLNHDASLLVHFDFDHDSPSDWRLRNSGPQGATAPEAAIVGCQWIEGRWPGKPAVEFRGVSDRVRLNVPGEFDSLTLAAWVRVQGLDRQFNSLFMCDGFEPGTVHWLIRHDGVLGLTAIGSDPADFQIVVSPAVLTLDNFGTWLHLAVVIDGAGRRVTQYVNGAPVGVKALKISPPFRMGPSELGNWNSAGFAPNDPFHIRNFSGAMDEFCLFSRALDAGEIHNLYAEGRPQPDPQTLR